MPAATAAAYAPFCCALPCSFSCSPGLHIGLQPEHTWGCSLGALGVAAWARLGLQAAVLLTATTTTTTHNNTHPDLLFLLLTSVLLVARDVLTTYYLLRTPDYCLLPTAY